MVMMDRKMSSSSSCHAGDHYRSIPVKRQTVGVTLETTLLPSQETITNQKLARFPYPPISSILIPNFNMLFIFNLSQIQFSSITVNRSRFQSTKVNLSQLQSIFDNLSHLLSILVNLSQPKKT